MLKIAVVVSSNVEPLLDLQETKRPPPYEVADE
jgi:hypothetical protein